MQRKDWGAWLLGTYLVLSLVSMATMSLGLIALLAALGFGLYGGKNRPAPLEKNSRWPRPVRIYAALSALLAVACLLSWVGAALWPLSYDGKTVDLRAQALVRDALKLWYFVLPLLVWAVLSRLTRASVASAFRAWLMAFGILSAVGIIQFYTGWPRPQMIPDSSPARYHATAFLGHHLSLASVFVFPFFVAMGMAISSGVAIGLSRLTLGGIALLGAAALFLTYSRMLWISLPVGIALWGALFLFKDKKIAKTWRFGAVLAFAAVLFAVLSSSNVQERIRSGIGIGTRFELWKANVEFLKERPLTGAGWRKNSELSGYYLLEKTGAGRVFSGHAHNNIIDMLGGTGLFGLLAWLAWSAWVFVLTVRASRSDRVFASALLCAWVVFHLNGLTQVNFWEGKVQHQMMIAVGVALWLVTRDGRDGAALARREKP